MVEFAKSLFFHVDNSKPLLEGKDGYPLVATVSSKNIVSCELLIFIQLGVMAGAWAQLPKRVVPAEYMMPFQE